MARYISKWFCNSDHDYYEQFEQPPKPIIFANTEDRNEADDDFDGDCDYWQSQCYGKG